jgi:hypothetical protein
MSLPFAGTETRLMDTVRISIIVVIGVLRALTIAAVVSIIVG